jgi:ATP-binding cassette subfamily F protein 3
VLNPQKPIVNELAKPSVSSNPNTGKQIRQLKTQIKTLEERLERLHRKLAEVDLALGNSDLYLLSDDTDLQGLLRDKLSLETETATVEEQWLERQEQLESLAPLSLN